MKKLFLFFSLLMLCTGMWAQTVTLTFTGRDAANNWVQLDRVSITNLTKGWQETLYWPDTTLTMQNGGTGIDDFVGNDGFSLSQNNPNPFNGTTDVNLTVADAGMVTLEITDANGRNVGMHRVRLQSGTHQFRVTLSAAGTYMMIAHQNGKSSSIKMVNNGGGNGDGIEYTGIVRANDYSPQQPKSHTRGTTANPFNFGDQMEYVGYATINGVEYESERITQAQGASQTFRLHFNVAQFDGQPCPNTPILTDIDGNTYNTVQIGSQCWMKENLRTTRYANFTEIPLGNTISFDDPYRYIPNNDESNVLSYGYLYNWAAVMQGASSSSSNPSGVQGICPTGWHVPSDAEWTQLTDYVSSQSQFVCSNTNTYIAKALASTTGWNSNNTTCAIGNIPSDNNVTGFGAMPAGLCSYQSFGTVSNWYGSYADFWSATERSGSTAQDLCLSWDYATVMRGLYDKRDGYSVRCLRDEGGESTVEIPTITTTSVTTITSSTATGGGNVTSEGGTTVTARGVCWSTSHNPTVGDSHTANGTGMGSFTSSLTGLTAGTTYYVRAYATNNVGTAYGDEIGFTTETETPQDAQPCPGTPTITDIDGNVYNTVKIGNQCWMKENLRTTRYANYIEIPLGNTTSNDEPYRYAPNNNESNVATYGYLYNWPAVMHGASSSSSNPSGVQGICPTGWHVPSDAEWTQLTDYVCSQSEYVCSNTNTYIAKALASSTGWNSSTNTCAVGNTTSGNNTTGFCALAASCYPNDFGNLGYNLGISFIASFWSATENGNSLAWPRCLVYEGAEVTRITSGKTFGYSVRCLRDEGITFAILPTVTTSPVTDVTSSTATSGGNVTSDGGATVTARGVCWSISHNPTVSGSHTTNGTGMGNFNSSLTGLSSGITYYVRAYATNIAGTAYGDEVGFTSETETLQDGQPCPNAATLTDIDGNTYNTVQIGSQCWMKENLRTTRYANYTEIPLGNTTSNDDPYRYAPNNNENNVATYGYLYNWAAVMHGASSSSANPSGVQGVCPTGWHVPSDAEWKQMEMAVGMSQSDAENSGWRGDIAAKLSGNIGWTPSPNANAAGNLSAPDRNSSGFSALPAGWIAGDYYDFFSFGATFWSATEDDMNDIVWDEWERSISYCEATVGRVHQTPDYGLSVRCLRDEGVTSASLPTVTTSSVIDITSSTATSGGNVTSDGGATVTARGVCWSISHNPTVSDSHTTNGMGIGSFTSSLTGLSSGTTYYVRAYATNSAGTSYGDEVSFTTSALQLPTVITSEVTNITAITATCGAEVTSDGGATVTARGVCWSISHNPTVSDSHTTNGTGMGSFTSSLTGLSSGTTYYVRAYATNSTGTAYGNEVSFTTFVLQVPTVITSEATNIATTTAICGGEVTSDGGATVTSRGVCWSISHNPTVSDSHTTNGTGMGSFTSSLTGLSSGTTYYVRAYATNSAGTAYGNEVSFATETETPQDGLPCPGASTLIDIDGNIYNTLQIGSQCWMKENLRTTKYADGTSISQGSSSTSTIVAYWYYPNNSSSNQPTYGLLYNWKAVMRNSSSSSTNPSYVQGICPNGWHVPSDAEWTQLTDYVSSQSQYVCGNDNRYIAKALAATSGWNSSTDTCAVGNIPSDNNATGFGAPAAGYYNGNHRDFGSRSYFWDSSELDSDFANFNQLFHGSATLGGSSSFLYKGNGLSVRCLRDEGVTSAILPTVSTSSVTDITFNTATSGGNVASDGGATVTTRGVCWSTSHNPTVSDSHTANGTGLGSFTSNLTGLSSGTTYYVRAYATNSAGTAYGNEVSFATETETPQDGQPCPGASTLTDIDGNIYNTVQIGSQCWMKENLRTTKYADGTSIEQGSSTSSYVAYWYHPNSSANQTTYGLLYNWKAVMRNSSSSSANPSRVQGICPTGWHVPSDAEWTQLTDYVSSQSQYVCGNDNRYIAKALAGTTGWTSSTDTCAVGNTPSGNNATGFSALPTGRYYGYDSYPDGFGEETIFWSATEYSSSAYGLVLTKTNAKVFIRNNVNKSYGSAVRCVRD